MIFFLVITAVFAGFCWGPMFLVDTPSWALWTQAVLVLILAFSSTKQALLMEQRRIVFWGKGNATDKRNATDRINAASSLTFAVSIVAYGAVFVLMFLAPGWWGWEWLFPVLATIICTCFYLLIFFLVAWASLA